jgi:hypothetical protein
MGIKARAEIGENIQLSESKDILWFSGIVLSGLLICLIVFIGRGINQSLIIPSVFSSCWLFTLFLFNPIPLYSTGLLLSMCGCFIYVIQTKSKGN